MRLLRFVGRSVLVATAALALAFVVSVWRDCFRDDEPRIAGSRPPELGVAQSVPMTDDQAPPPRHLPTPQGTAPVLSKLKRGMTRTEVEGLVGLPAARDIHPATVENGKVTYHTTYEADLAPLLRPLRGLHPVARAPLSKERVLVSLEFDATQPGHPLLCVHYPDPLF